MVAGSKCPTDGFALDRAGCGGTIQTTIFVTGSGAVLSAWNFGPILENSGKKGGRIMEAFLATLIGSIIFVGSGLLMSHFLSDDSQKKKSDSTKPNL